MNRPSYKSKYSDMAEGTTPQLVIDKVDNSLYGLFQRFGNELHKFKQENKWITFRSLTAPIIGALAWAKRNHFNLVDPDFEPVNERTAKLLFSEKEIDK